MRVTQVAAAAAVIGAVLMTGCHVESSKQDGKDNVRIATPFGAMQVKTNDATVLQGMGLPAYPGATLVKKNKDNGAADVNMSFGNFHLRLKAAGYQTTDSSDKVETFYRKALGVYGDVISCVNDKSVGEPTHTSEGLTCENDDKHVSVNKDVSGKLQLKAGSKQHQHIVAIEPNGDGTKIGLVALDLPGDFSNNKQSEQ